VKIGEDLEPINEDNLFAFSRWRTAFAFGFGNIAKIFY
jgi:hypothetical protein